MDGQKEKVQKIKSAFAELGSTIARSIGFGIKNFKDLAKTRIDTANQIIKAAFSTSVANMIKSGPTRGLLGIALAVAGITAVKAMFDKNVPALAMGGLAYGPTLAMVGDNPGAASDPEVIAPLSKLQSMTPQVHLHGRFGISMGEMRMWLEEIEDHYLESH